MDALQNLILQSLALYVRHNLRPYHPRLTVKDTKHGSLVVCVASMVGIRRLALHAHLDSLGAALVTAISVLYRTDGFFQVLCAVLVGLLAVSFGMTRAASI